MRRLKAIADLARRLDAWRWLARAGPVVALAFVFGLFAFLRGEKFVNLDNFQIMLVQTAVVGTAAVGMTLVIVSGGIDLSVGSVIALCTVVIGLLVKAGIPPVFAALGGIACAAACGLLSGTLITRLKLMPFIVTLGMMGALRGIAKGMANQKPVYPGDTANGFLGLIMKLTPENSWTLYPPGVWIMLVLGVLVAAMLRHTRIGRHMFAIGSNEATARLCGIDVERTKEIVYTIGTMLVGVAALLHYSYLTGGDPTTAQGYELNIIAAVVIGGASLSGGEGSVLGSIVGAFIMTMVANGCTKMDFPNWIQEIVTGGIIIAAVTLDNLRHRAER